VAGPGDRRDEDIVAIAETVAGRFDHYICRRDDDLRGREPDAVPKMIAKVLRDKGVSEAQITIIPDEQEAIDHGLRMGRQGDLLLVFADALARSWKQVTKFRPEGAPATAAPSTKAPPLPVDDASDSLLGTKGGGGEGDGMLESAGFVRDERGIRFVKESED
jgi:cyanophycin synthetase